MDENQDRDALLHEILRETAADKSTEDNATHQAPPSSAPSVSADPSVASPSNTEQPSAEAPYTRPDVDAASYDGAYNGAYGNVPTEDAYAGEGAVNAAPEEVQGYETAVPEDYGYRNLQDPTIRTDTVPRDFDHADAYDDASYDRAQTEQFGAVPPVQDTVYGDLEGDSQGYRLTDEPSAGHKKKKKRHRGFITLVMTIAILALSIGLSAVIIVYGQDLLGINADTSTKMVTIPTGATMDEIAEILEEEGIISHPDFFVFIAGLSDMDTDIKSGDHELRPDMAYETILSELVSDPLDGAESVTITFTEGIRLVDAADLLEENNVCDADEFLEYFNSEASFGYTFEDYLPSFTDDKFYVMEGYFFPDTYTFYQEMSVELVCQKIFDNFDSKITEEYYDRMEILGMSLDEVITLASIIQKEAGSTEDMTMVSSVFWNRLNNATEYPLLQSDVTYYYVEEVIKPHSDVYDQDLYDAYDTYTCTGLPAGAICNPGADAIYAALYPDSSSYYYFYADTETGETYFATTLEEHEANQEMVEALHEDDSDDEDTEE